MAVVYFHYKLNTKELFYVGIGVNKSRAYSKKSRNPLWYNIVEKNGYYVEIYKNGISYEDAKKEEIELIRMHGRLDIKTGILCNMTDGGDGHQGMSNECKKRISESLKGRKMPQNIIEKLRVTKKILWNSDEYAENREKARVRAIKYMKLGIISRKGCISARKGVKLREEEKVLISQKLIKFYENNEPSNKVHRKVLQKDKDGNIIKVWNSHHDACKFFNNPNVKNLIKVCNKKGRSYMGYVWDYCD